MKKRGRTNRRGPSYFAMWVDALADEEGTSVIVDLGSCTFQFLAVAGEQFGGAPVEIVAGREELQTYVRRLIGRDGTVYGRWWPFGERSESDPEWEAFVLFLIHVDEFFADADELAGTRWRLDPELFFVRTV